MTKLHTGAPPPPRSSDYYPAGLLIEETAPERGALSADNIAAMPRLTRITIAAVESSECSGVSGEKWTLRWLVHPCNLAEKHKCFLRVESEISFDIL